ncbi:hypothetical protein COO60DRAFT_640897 [Scenedesmus sp. NREL 46B-D3]|nr:hypothetical protein COO60DRAFT_640897 [Scenedesmus sp. NREL 46B-D3]
MRSSIAVDFILATVWTLPLQGMFIVTHLSLQQVLSHMATSSHKMQQSYEKHKRLPRLPSCHAGGCSHSVTGAGSGLYTHVLAAT